MRFRLFLILIMISFLPVYVQAAPASVPFWINSADAYAHYTLDRTDYSDTGRQVYPDSSTEYHGSSTFAVSSTGDLNHPDNWQYNLYIENNKNSGYDYSTRSDDELIYLWVEYTYFRPDSGYTSGGLSYSHLSGNDVWNNLNLNETRVDADLNWTSGPLYTSEIHGNDTGNTPGNYETYAYMFRITPSQQDGDNGWPWDNYIQWRTDDDVYLSDVYAATISYQNYSTSSVPVPGALLPMGSGLIGLIGARRRFQ